MTYKGFRGYMPMVGHLAENGLVVYDEFRQGNVAPAARNLEFIKQCERQMPKGKRIGYIRADAASYQAEIFNYCEERRIVLLPKSIADFGLFGLLTGYYFYLIPHITFIVPCKENS